MTTPGSLSRPFFDLGTSLFRRAAAQQGGLLDGEDPTAFSTADPFRLWVIQLGVIIMTTQVLSLGLGKIRQPKVIAEVLGGIVLGPTLMGRIPGFTQHIFPSQSRPYLALTADIGLVLFLFLVGLEIDTKMIARNARTSLIIAIGGICLPFGLGVGVAVPLYHQFVESYSASFPHFMLFVGVAFSITAFPVLCRILTELKMLDDVIGVVVLSAGVGNDIVGWILLALTVALVNAGTGLTALYVLLVSAGWTLATLFPCRWFFKWLAKWTGSAQKGPTPLFMTATILFTFGNAFMTDIIGVNAIFGGFLAGLAIPRDGGLNITITEKLEDMVAIIFLPLYFTLSGLSTNLGLLNTGKIWGYTIMILTVAYSGKFTGGTLAARLAGFTWRESATVGTLMSCKGLIELIVLNVGLSAGILDTRIFSMFVLEALVLTFASTPVALWLYPPHLRKRVSPIGGGAGHGKSQGRQQSGNTMPLVSDRKSRFLVVLEGMEHVPSIMAVTQLIQPPTSPLSTPDGLVTEVEALRLIELTDRTSDLMRSSAVEDIMVRDPLLSIYHKFGSLHNIAVFDRLAVAQYEMYHESVGVFAREAEADMIILSWQTPLPSSSTESAISPVNVADGTAGGGSDTSTPLEALFKSRTNASTSLSRNDRLTSVAHSHFLRRLFASAPTDVALFIDSTNLQANPALVGGSDAHLVVPFFGGPDDRLALEFAVQLCARDEISATVFRMIKDESTLSSSVPEEGKTKGESTGEAAATATERNEYEENAGAGMTIQSTIHSMRGFPDTIYPNITTQTRLASETADNISWFKYAPADASHTAPSHPPIVQSALGRMEFITITSPTPLRQLIQTVASMASNKRMVVIAGRGKRLAVESHQDEMKLLLGAGGSATVINSNMGNEMRKTLGDVPTAFLASGVSAELLVMQASAAKDGLTA
ncbi:K(+)/H(+) antiporter [Tulasnella sp. JGI-2019a]|nr:K(+)/H(+) antiporter [Tulasnella sp. JGI-2019a]KAG9014108.1 K(+)/H(+) antiporter [Tulasnella sp. JGI-2019a]KAG9028795.1 K(+)/H(+) antiporter [Tulasnella sp. JGI-2019a]